MYLLREIWQPAAFCYGPFVLNNVATPGLKGNIWNEAGKFGTEKYVKSIMPKFSGLYFFFLSTHGDDKNVDDIEKQGNIYPFYVGITDESFHRRFSRHSNDKGGVMYKIRESGWQIDKQIPNSPRIVAYVIDMPYYPVAKLFETLFLSLFDFAWDSSENGRTRIHLETKNSKTVQDGWEHFKIGYNKIKTNLENTISLTVIKEKETNLKYYNFEN